jgi:hypothetical protein
LLDISWVYWWEYEEIHFVNKKKVAEKTLGEIRAKVNYRLLFKESKFSRSSVYQKPWKKLLLKWLKLITAIVDKLAFWLWLWRVSYEEKIITVLLKFTIFLFWLWRVSKLIPKEIFDIK